jgi:hypothetical protein
MDKKKPKTNTHRVAKVVFGLMYFVSGGVVSFFLPVEVRYCFGYVAAAISVWAWKVITMEEVNHG